MKRNTEGRGEGRARAGEPDRKGGGTWTEKGGCSRHRGTAGSFQELRRAEWLVRGGGQSPGGPFKGSGVSFHDT